MSRPSLGVRPLVFFLILFSARLVYADHATIVGGFDAGKYDQTASLLQQLKIEDPVRYGTFPYALLHAKALERTKDLNTAADIYRQQVAANPMIAEFALLPLARILVIQNKVDDAIAAYQSYLRHGTYSDYTAVALEAFDLCQDHAKSD